MAGMDRNQYTPVMLILSIRDGSTNSVPPPHAHVLARPAWLSHFAPEFQAIQLTCVNVTVSYLISRKGQRRGCGVPAGNPTTV